MTDREQTLDDRPLAHDEVEILGRYNSEVSRGIRHNEPWRDRMAELQRRFDTNGWLPRRRRKPQGRRMSGHSERILESNRPSTVRDAETEWGCAFERCLEPARFVVTTTNGSQWGACKRHLGSVRRKAEQRV